MKNKAITVVCVILILAAFLCVGYIFIFSEDPAEVPANNNNNEEQVQEQLPPVEETPREERGQNIIVTSRIGVQLREVIRTSNLYSNVIVDEIDKNGFSDQAKVLLGLDKIHRKEEYMSFAEYSDDYDNNYITAENMHKVIGNTFVEGEIVDVGVEDTLPYDEATKCYIIPSIGYSSGTLSYNVEVPYKITEYADRIELLAYRVYITKTVEMNGIEASIKNEIFYDKEKSLPAMTVTDTSLEYEPNQATYLKTKIDDKTIDSTSLESVQYIFKVEDDVYKLSEFKNI